MEAKYTTKNQTNYINVRLGRDAKLFEKNEKGPAAAFITFAHNTKGNDTTVWIDARVVRGADLIATLRKGDIVNSVRGTLTFKTDNQGEVRGVMYDAEVDIVRTGSEASTTNGSGAPAFD